MIKLPQLKKLTRERWELSCTVDGVVVQWENFPSDIRRFGDRRYKATWAKAFAYYAAFCARVTLGFATPGVALEFLFKDYPDLKPFSQLILESLLESQEGIDFLRLGVSALHTQGKDYGFISELAQNQPIQRRLQNYPELRSLGWSH